MTTKLLIRIVVFLYSPSVSNFLIARMKFKHQKCNLSGLKVSTRVLYISNRWRATQIWHMTTLSTMDYLNSHLDAFTILPFKHNVALSLTTWWRLMNCTLTAVHSECFRETLVLWNASTCMKFGNDMKGKVVMIMTIHCHSLFWELWESSTGISCSTCSHCDALLATDLWTSSTITSYITVTVDQLITSPIHGS